MSWHDDARAGRLRTAIVGGVATADAEAWAVLERDPAFRAGMERARSEHEAGRFAPFRHRTPRPERTR